MNNIKLQKNAMTFTLPKGEILHITEEDFRFIVNKLVVEMSLHNQTKICMYKETYIDKSNTLYNIFIKEKSNMSDELKEEYLRKILSIMDSIPEEETVKDMLKKPD